jgi:hypothetical protein
MAGLSARAASLVGRHRDGGCGALEENRVRVEKGDQVKDRLTLHDWAENKAILAEHLEPRHKALRDELVRAYGAIFEAMGGASPPTLDQLGGLKRQPDDEKSRL